MASKEKDKPAEEQKPTALVPAATDPTPLMAAEEIGDIVGDAGQGVSSRQEDNLVPLMYVLQGLSPQVDKRNREAYIEGAEPGHFWLRNAVSHEIVNGETGLLFQPCYWNLKFVEWTPRSAGGGMVAQHDDMPRDVDEVRDEKNPRRIHYINAAGNEIIETRYHFGFVYGGAFGIADAPDFCMPYVLPQKGSGIRVSKSWETMKNQFFMQDMLRHYFGDAAAKAQLEKQPKLRTDRAPSYSHVYRLVTKTVKNAQGTWSIISPSPHDWASKEQYARGKALFTSINEGALRAEAERDVGDHEESGGDGSAADREAAERAGI